MSQSKRYRVVPSSIEGRFAVYDTCGQCIVHDGIANQTIAFARAKGLNRAVTPSSTPSGYHSAPCQGCGAAMFIMDGQEAVCPQCVRERNEINDRIDWQETRERELLEARRSVEDYEVREFARVGDRWDGLE